MIAAGTGLIAATAAGPARGAARGRQEAADGTPEQIHLTWGDGVVRVAAAAWRWPPLGGRVAVARWFAARSGAGALPTAGNGNVSRCD
jgi:hypothetical protein